MGAAATLKKGEGRGIKSGGMWVYDNEIASVSGSFRDGDVVDVRDFDGYYLGKGFINSASKIRIRLMSRDASCEIDDDFFRRRLRRAWEYRKSVVDVGSCRVVFGEADFLPGLVVDKFFDVLVVQSLSLGIDRYKEDIARILKEELARDGICVRGVYERNDAGARRREGMKPVKGFIGDEFDTDVKIVENGINYIVDVKNGQKTGFFLDQKYNRLAIRGICEGKRVLDCFSHTGSFALNAAKAGASSVLGIDSSEHGIKMARINAELNGLSDIARFECADVFERLPEYEAAGEKFDVIILDPPAFAKSKNAVKNAVKGYREINLRAMRLLEDGGYLATCSCSHFVDDAMFAKTIWQAAGGAHKRLRMAYAASQSPDHPVLWAAGESHYLKFYIFQVLDFR